MKFSSIFIILFLSFNAIHINGQTIKKPHPLFANIPKKTNQLIDNGTNNIADGYHKILPKNDLHQFLQSNHSSTRTILGIGQIIAGALQVGTGKILQTVYNNPHETMAVIVIPVMIKCLMTQDSEWEN